MAADVIVVDLDKSQTLPVYDVVSTLVHSSRADNVKHTIAGGRVLVRDGAMTGVDEAEIRAKFREKAHALRQRNLG